MEYREKEVTIRKEDLLSDPLVITIRWEWNLFDGVTIREGDNDTVCLTDSEVRKIVDILRKEGVNI